MTGEHDTGRTGADTLAETLLAGGVDVCFANPGTSEMHFVGALDRLGGMRSILGLFEGVVTGAADGFYRIADRPAATLLHLAPGLGNGLANLHNAKKARSGIVNIVGDHATYYAQIESPLAGDVAGLARPMSAWVRTTSAVEHLGSDAAEAIQIASGPPGRIATLILPADVSWNAGGPAGRPLPPSKRRQVPVETIVAAAASLRRLKHHATLLLGNVGVRASALAHAARIAAATGCRLLGEIHNARMERGAGRVSIDRIPYTQPVETALNLFSETQVVVLAGAPAPLAFFAYPDKPTRLTPPGCAIIELADAADDVEAALEALADYLIASAPPAQLQTRSAETSLPRGPNTSDGLGEIIAKLLPANAIVVDEAVTAGRSFFKRTQDAAPHDWLSSTGASIGFALPTAIGAAVAAPDRKVLALTGDGSGMYTLQALWTMAREGLDVTIVVFANRSYQILRGEFANLGLGTPGARANAMLSLDDPALDWCALAKGHGVEAGQAKDLESFAVQLRRGFSSAGPYLIEVLQ